MVQAFIFYMLAGVVLVSGLMVVVARNPVHAVLWLILAFFNAAGLFLVIGAEFLAMVLVIVYVGAVAVLFLFVVMMLDVDFRALRQEGGRLLPLGLLLAAVLAVELVLVGWAWGAGALAPGLAADPVAARPQLTNIEALGAVLYTRYLLIFQASGLILLTAMIGAIVLTHRKRGGVRRQDIGRQIARTPAAATRLERPPVGEGVDVRRGVRLSGGGREP